MYANEQIDAIITIEAQAGPLIVCPHDICEQFESRTNMIRSYKTKVDATGDAPKSPLTMLSLQTCRVDLRACFPAKHPPHAR